MENSELFKTLRTIIMYEREVYLLYAEAAKKMRHEECRNVLALVSEQTRMHMKSVSKMYGDLLESYGILDNETMDTLSFMRDALSSNKIDTTDLREILNTCINIEAKMAEMYRHIAEEKEFELEFLSLGGAKEKLAKLMKQISAEEEMHSKCFNEILTKFSD